MVSRYSIISETIQSVGSCLRVWLIIVIFTRVIDETTSLTWRNCSLSDLQNANAKCVFLTVPLDYGKPNGRTLRIALSRIAHTSSEAHHQGVLLVKIGGPTAAGLTNSFSPFEAASSYTTYVSQLYATQYPGKVGRMVLDSSVDFTRIWYERILDLNEVIRGATEC